jgi:hypothetical protein
LADIEALRRQRLSGPQIARALGMARSTVGLLLRRLGLGRLSLIDPKPVVVRYEKAAPGELIHIDIKTLGKIDGIGHRITGQHAGHHRARGVGHEHLHVAIDDASRLAYTEVLPEPGPGGRHRLSSTSLGLVRPPRRDGGARDDRHGSAYRSKLFARALQNAGVRHVQTRPYTPRTNGKAERFIQTSLREWAYARPYASSQQRNAPIGPWIDDYNLNRPHSAIGHQTPFKRLNNLLGNDS